MAKAIQSLFSWHGTRKRISSYSAMAGCPATHRQPSFVSRAYHKRYDAGHKKDGLEQCPGNPETGAAINGVLRQWAQRPKKEHENERRPDNNTADDSNGFRKRHDV
jgi:hypothetical protein